MATTVTGTTYFTISQPVYNECLAIVQQAQAKWSALVQQFAAENIAMGISSNPAMVKLIADTLQTVNYYGTAGSLWEAYNSLSNITVTAEMAPFLTQARLDWMRNQMIQVLSAL